MNALDQMTVPFHVITSGHVLQESMFKMRTDDALFVFFIDGHERFGISQ